MPHSNHLNPQETSLSLQQGGAFHHPPRPTAGAEAAPFATEGHEVFGMAGVTANPQEAMLKTAAFEVVFEFPLDILRQFRALCAQLGHESGIVLLY